MVDDAWLASGQDICGLSTQKLSVSAVKTSSLSHCLRVVVADVVQMPRRIVYPCSAFDHTNKETEESTEALIALLEEYLHI